MMFILGVLLYSVGFYTVAGDHGCRMRRPAFNFRPVVEEPRWMSMRSYAM
jgi:hypothetical protein